MSSQSEHVSNRSIIVRSRYYAAVGAALVCSFLLSVFAALRGGYIGPDYPTHLSRLTDWSRIFDWGTTSPPTYYLLGHALFVVIGHRNAFPITLSIIQAAVNTFALAVFFRWIAPRFVNLATCIAFMFFATFLPVRLIHSTTIGTDCTTIPMFVLLLLLFSRLVEEAKPAISAAVALGLGLTVSIACKYSFMALIPAVFALLIFSASKWRWGLRRFLAVTALVLVLPIAFSLFSFWASSRVHGYNTEKHWLAKGESPDMNYRDLFSIKAADAQLFRAPEYFKREILAAHRHGYLALVHLGVFADTMNLFQVLTVPQEIDRILIPDQKARRPWKTAVMIASMSLGVVWTLLALFAIPWAVVRVIRHFRQRRLEREDVALILGAAFFLIIFLAIPFVHGGAIFGYWTPRLILPALLYFFCAGFLFVDRKIAPRARWVPGTTFAVVLVQCLLAIVMLV